MFKTGYLRSQRRTSLQALVTQVQVTRAVVFYWNIMQQEWGLASMLLCVRCAGQLSLVTRASSVAAKLHGCPVRVLEEVVRRTLSSEHEINWLHRGSPAAGAAARLANLQRDEQAYEHGPADLARGLGLGGLAVYALLPVPRVIDWVSRPRARR